MWLVPFLAAGGTVSSEPGFARGAARWAFALDGSPNVAFDFVFNVAFESLEVFDVCGIEVIDFLDQG
jgi:hypothetical protein